MFNTSKNNSRLNPAEKKKLDDIRNPKNPNKSVTFRFDEHTLLKAKAWLDNEEISYTSFPKKPGKVDAGMVFVFEDQDDAIIFKMHWQNEDLDSQGLQRTQEKW